MMIEGGSRWGYDPIWNKNPEKENEEEKRESPNGSK